MKITTKDVNYVASLARLKFSGEQTEKLVGEMESIINFADMLAEVDTDGVEPTFHAIALENVLREDVVTNRYDRDKLLQNAPSRSNGCFEVPKVVE
jgi:aspartyl-tRNA(Asn)/glutamyl-tRNA(Gln) amidotransferase subunit C